MTAHKLLASLLLSASLLVACGKKETQEVTVPPASLASSTTSESSSTSSTSSSSQTSETDSSTTSSSSSSSESTAATSTPAHYNGSYYAIQGKYDEIIIVNKKHPLDSSYGFGEDPTALAAFQSLLADMQAQGYPISSAYSGFRSYDTQAGLYNNYVSNDGREAADRYSARPGYSEHQTGLAFDIIDGNGSLLEEPQASQWLQDNAHHYGFIVRYLPGKEHITGYMPEPWHIRYIGKEASDIHASGLTLEEYFGIPGGDY